MWNLYSGGYIVIDGSELKGEGTSYSITDHNLAEKLKLNKIKVITNVDDPLNPGAKMNLISTMYEKKQDETYFMAGIIYKTIVHLTIRGDTIKVEYSLVQTQQ